MPLESLVKQYPDLATLLHNPKVRESHGIPGDGPWPVVLAGYVMNALARTAEEVRRVAHTADVGDEFFVAWLDHSKAPADIGVRIRTPLGMAEASRVASNSIAWPGTRRSQAIVSFGAVPPAAISSVRDSPGSSPLSDRSERTPSTAR